MKRTRRKAAEIRMRAERQAGELINDIKVTGQLLAGRPEKPRMARGFRTLESLTPRPRNGGNLQVRADLRDFMRLKHETRGSSPPCYAKPRTANRLARPDVLFR